MEIVSEQYSVAKDINKKQAGLLLASDSTCDLCY